MIDFDELREDGIDFSRFKVDARSPEFGTEAKHITISIGSYAYGTYIMDRGLECWRDEADVAEAPPEILTAADVVGRVLIGVARKLRSEIATGAKLHDGDSESDDRCGRIAVGTDGPYIENGVLLDAGDFGYDPDSDDCGGAAFARVVEQFAKFDQAHQVPKQPWGQRWDTYKRMSERAWRLQRPTSLTCSVPASDWTWWLHHIQALLEQEVSRCLPAE